ncbi:MAG: epoxyqueuosine reductase QueH [Thermodesulfovibrionales bacterium]
MRLLIHTCCANCSIYPVQRLRSRGIDLTGLWFNPNIHPFEEYNLRLASLKRLSEQWRFPVMYNDTYDMELFLRGFLESSEVFLAQELSSREDFYTFENPDLHSILDKASLGKRCQHCYRLRLEETARAAKDNGFDAFSTTLLVSPYQNFELIVNTGNELAQKYNIEFFPEDFRPGYREALNVSREMGLYRQKYCGCIFSKVERGKAAKQQNNRRLRNE